MAFIEFEGVSKIFGREQVLSDVSFTVEEGEICGFTGRNGSGKTVIFKLLSGLLLPDSGRILYRGEDLTGKKKFIESLGILIETPGFIPHYSGLRNLKILNSMSKRRVRTEELKHIMELTGLNPENKKPVRAYSLGMKQKLGIAQAIMNRPELLILDEPMNSLDAQSVIEMRQLFLRLKQENHTTILVASHIREDIEALCGRMFIVRDHTVEAGKREEENGNGAEEKR